MSASPRLLTLLVGLSACKAVPVGDDELGATDTTGTSTDTGTETGEEPACPAQTPSQLMDCVDPVLYQADLEFISEPREPGSAHWQEVQDLCADRFEELGYEVTLQDYGTGINVVGVRPGLDAAGQRVIVGAHYDHIPGCSGADDNGTGVAALLELARILVDIPTQQTLVVTCWDEEELGLIGSAAQAQLTVDEGQVISGVLSLDSIGVASDQPDSQVVPDGFDLLFPDQYAELEANQFRGDFLLWVSDDTMMPVGEALDGFAEQVDLSTLGTSLDDDLKVSPLLADLRRSDHASFWDLDIPAMLLNDSGEFRYASYHCSDGADDIVDKVDPLFVIAVTKVAVASTAVALGM